MFQPMALAVSFAIIGALLLSLTYVPAATALFLSLIHIYFSDNKAPELSGLKNFFWNNLYSFQFQSILLNPPKY